MSAISLRIPEYLHRRAKKLAREEKISINQFIATALAEKIAALETEEYLKKRAQRGSRKKFEKALSKVADVEPEDQDSR